jgi:hypothetical protein
MIQLCAALEITRHLAEPNEPPSLEPRDGKAKPIGLVGLGTYRDLPKGVPLVMLIVMHSIVGDERELVVPVGRMTAPKGLVELDHRSEICRREGKTSGT